MCQICLSLDRVEVQNSVEQITARLAVTENRSHGESVWLISCRGLLTEDSRCYPSWLGNSRLSETAHKIGFVHSRETSCALDVQRLNWSVLLPPKHSLSTGEIRNMETAMSCDSFFFFGFSYFYDHIFPETHSCHSFNSPHKLGFHLSSSSETLQIGFNISDLTYSQSVSTPNCPMFTI